LNATSIGPHARFPKRKRNARVAGRFRLGDIKPFPPVPLVLPPPLPVEPVQEPKPKTEKDVTGRLTTGKPGLR
jgi:hypothetical protein